MTLSALAFLLLNLFAQDPSITVIRNVSIIDVENGHVRQGRVVLIEGPRIRSITLGTGMKTPPGANVIDGSGKYLIPGLWDMHVHISEADFPKFLQAGVTSVRDMGGDVRELAAWRADLQGGRLSGPKLRFGGPRLVGPPAKSTTTSWVLDSPFQAKAAVDSLKKLGVDFIKVHDNLTSEVYAAVVAEAHRVGLEIVGHVSALVTPAAAAASKQKSIEHLEFVPKNCMGMFASGWTDAPPACTTAAFQRLFASFAKQGVWLTPTISMFRVYVPEDAYGMILDGFRQLVPIIRRGHVRILTGTDEEGSRILPGTSLHDEMKLLVESGFTPLEVLQSATINPARFFGVQRSLGSIAVGRRADLVLLDANPITNIRAMSQVSAVLLDGKVVFQRR